MTGPDARAAARDAFLARAGWSAAEVEWRPGDASFRRYARLTRGAETAILMDAPPPRESVGPFLRVGAMLADAGLATPQVIATDSARGFLVLEDFGDETFTALLDRGAAAGPLYDMAVDALIKMRREVGGARELPAYDPGPRVRHLSTFTDWLLPEVRGHPTSPAERAVLEALWLAALKRAPTLGRGFVHRDFHVDNLIRLKGRAGVAACGVLDYQDAGFGPYAYDLATLVEDERRELDPALKARCLERYRAAFPELTSEATAAALAAHGGQRHLRVAGLWVRLWRRDGKPGYLKHMRRTLAHLESSLRHPLLADVRLFLDAAFPAEARDRAIALEHSVR